MSLLPRLLFTVTLAIAAASAARAAAARPNVVFVMTDDAGYAATDIRTPTSISLRARACDSPIFTRCRDVHRRAPRS